MTASPSPTGQLHIVTVHGTFGGRAYLDNNRLANKEFYSEHSDFSKSLREKLPNSKWHEFIWSGKNLESARHRAARQFRKYLTRLPLGPGDRLLLLAHSHGGNVALNGLRRAPVTNPLNLFSFGAPFIQKSNPSIWGILGLLIPGLIFFLAFCFIAAIIAQGHIQYIAYGTPFFEPTNKSINAFFEGFNQNGATLTAFVIVGLSFFWFMVWPLTRLIHSTRFDYDDAAKFRLHQVWRRDDEAIVMLASEPRVSFPIRIFSSFFRSVSALVFLIFVALTLHGSYLSLQKYREEVDASAGLEYILLLEAEVIGVGLTVVAVILLLNLFIQLVFRVPLTWILSQPINSVLRKSAIGEDGYQRLRASHTPNIPEKFVTAYNESSPTAKKALEDVKKQSDKHLLDHRAEIMQAMTTGDGYLEDVLGQSDLSLSLIHCNYFTDLMAKFIAATLQKDLKPEPETPS
ncbi:MAG: hypothetical protein HKN36_05070 [Hellea sp.]|nr:hypothetical protein [Hellea sp.]